MADALVIDGLHVHYGEAHVVQGVSLTLPAGVMSVVGRNGMGKTTLCNTIVGLKRATSGSIRVAGREIARLEPHQINRLGVAYVPQGRRVWPSLSVDEHLRLVAPKNPDAAWTLDRVYQTFPRLAERRTNGGSQLSGGEQQMLAIARALLANPRLLVMDEPTEGLAPVIVEQLERILVQLGQDGDMSILVIEQNIGVACEVSQTVAIMVNGRINRVLDSGVLAADRDLQQRLLGVGRHADEAPPEPERAPADSAESRLAQVYVVDRGQAPAARRAEALPNRWSLPAAALREERLEARAPETPEKKVFRIPPSERFGRTALVVGTFDTKGRELRFLADRIKRLGVAVRTVDLSTSGNASRCDVTPPQVAAYHPNGASAVFGSDRGRSVTAMGEAFARWIQQERGIGGVISAGGSGGTSLATAGMRALPVGVPKVMVSTVASGDTRAYVGATDITMVYAVADVQGLNRITERVLGNAAHALAGMIARLPTADELKAEEAAARPAIGLTMFGVTTTCVQKVQRRLEGDYDCLVFHATGTGGKAMETLGHSGLLSGFLDITTTEVADMLVGGVFPCDADRFGAAIETGRPWVGAPGACDMVNFGARATVPDRFNGRNFVIHNPSVTLMRTTPEENARIGQWIGERMNLMDGPARFLIPEHGVSALDKAGGPFHDPAADRALFEAIEGTVRQTARRQVIRVPAHINDDAFASALVDTFTAVAGPMKRSA